MGKLRFDAERELNLILSDRIPSGKSSTSNPFQKQVRNRSRNIAFLRCETRSRFVESLVQQGQNSRASGNTLLRIDPS